MGSTSLAQTVARGAIIEITTEIVAIDHDARLITLEDEDGDIEEIYAGPEVMRFDELKVGDEVNFEYYESLVSHIRKPGDPAPPASDEVVLARGTGARPSGAIAEQMSATVTITEMDKDVPSVTIETEDGRTMSVKIADKEILEGVKVGDRVDITYTTAVLITVE